MAFNFRFDELLTTRAFETDPDFRWCPNPSCSAGQFIQEGCIRLVHITLNTLAKISFYTCIACGHKSCFECRGPSHLGLTCVQYKSTLARRGLTNEESASIKWLNANTRTCYSCGRYCEKISGCDHMTCTPGIGGCGAEWCWTCGAKYKDIRLIGNRAHKKHCLYYS